MSGALKTLAAFAVVLAGCGDNIAPAGDDTDDMPPDDSGWMITVDMSGLDRFVPAGTAMWPVAGRVESSLPLAGVDVAGMPAPLTGDRFEQSVATMLGMTVVPIVARDEADHVRQAHRTLLQAHFLPEGDINDRLATIVLTDQVLGSINAQIAQQTAGIDLAAQIMAQDPFYSDENCTIRPATATVGTLAVELQRRAGTELWLSVRVPNLNVTFSGECVQTGIIGPALRVAGVVGGTFAIETKLTANPPAAGEVCLSSFAHTLPTVEITNWVYDVNSPDGPVQTAIVRTLAPTSDEARQQTHDGLVEGADSALTDQLGDLSVLEQTQMFEGLGGPVQMHVCLAGLGPEGGKLIVRIAGDVKGQGTRVAPGAPLLATAAPVTRDNEMLLDTGLITMLTYSAWRDNAFVQSQPQAVEIALLALLVRPLADAFPNATHADVAVDGELPPFVRATPDVMGADMRFEVADLMVTMSIEGTMIMKFNLHLRVDIDFKAMDGMLVPTVVGSVVEAFLIDELYDGPDDALEFAIEAGLSQAIGDLLGGDMAGVGIPEIIPGIGRVTDILPDEGGRYLRMLLAPE